ITDPARVGIYGMTYKENVDDIRESPTMQMLECMEKHLAHGVKVYDPYVTKDICENQYHDFDAFLNDIDILVIMVAHDEIKNADEKIKNKLILDTRNVCKLEGIYKL
ncbi:MAG: nucleotide sugar dehydrogenase, partial [Clostridia bacterium]|nr:nucleotide sugar dehydrogenase [Clostridia bacterium]